MKPLPFFFAPEIGDAGDVTPFFHDGVFHLFYLKDLRDEPYDSSAELAHAPDSRLSFHHLTTRDFVDFADHGEAFPRGSATAADFGMGTGSIIATETGFCFFYTGMNPNLEQPQVQLLAHSPDLWSWQKVSDITVGPPDNYEVADFRDPFVLPNPTGPGYWMLLAARTGTAPWHRRGLTALATSQNLRDWEFGAPLYAPDKFYTHECPDLFQIDSRWYLLFSEFSRAMQTRYVLSESPHGPFRAPRVDSLDGRACYAAKTVSDGNRRYLIGWIPRRTSDGAWLWGGNLVVSEIRPNATGELAPYPLPQLASQGTSQAVVPTVVSGTDIDFVPNGWRTSSSKFCLVSLGAITENFSLQMDLDISHSGGLMLSATPDFQRGFELRFTPEELILDNYPRRGEQPVLASRPLLGDSGHHQITLLKQGDALQIISAGTVALSWRLTGAAVTHLGLFAEDGAAAVRDISIRS